jgi:methyl coenzyme M reductase alpha subunit
MNTPILDHTIRKISGDIIDLEEYTHWYNNGELCVDCQHNMLDDRCKLIDNGEAHECPGFIERYQYAEINPETHLEYLTTLDHILSFGKVMINGKYYKLQEVKNDIQNSVS